MTLLNTAIELKDTHPLIHTFTINSGLKSRVVNNPIPVLKSALKVFNKELTEYYQEQLRTNKLENIAHAYLPNKSIITNADIHKYSREIIKFDFSHFYDDVRYQYVRKDLQHLIPELNQTNSHLIKRLIINPKTNGITQGLPVSGALAGLALIPFWKRLKKLLPANIRFTQYSDDLTFSYTGPNKPEKFNIGYLTYQIERALKQTNRHFTLNKKKTAIQKDQFRVITGVHINNDNQRTPTLKDYRFLRSFAYNLRKGTPLNECLDRYGFESKEAFVGKISFLRTVDESGKIDKLLYKYASTFTRNNLFTAWLHTTNPFA